MEELNLFMQITTTKSRSQINPYLTPQKSSYYKPDKNNQQTMTISKLSFMYSKCFQNVLQWSKNDGFHT